MPNWSDQDDVHRCAQFAKRMRFRVADRTAQSADIADYGISQQPTEDTDSKEADIPSDKRMGRWVNVEVREGRIVA